MARQIRPKDNQKERTRPRRQLQSRQRRDRARHPVLLLTAAAAIASSTELSSPTTPPPPSGGIAGFAAAFPTFAPAPCARTSRRKAQRQSSIVSGRQLVLLPSSQSPSSLSASADLDVPVVDVAVVDPPSSKTQTAGPDTASTASSSSHAPTVHPDLLSQAIASSAKRRGSESYRRSYNRWSSTALGHVRARLAASLPIHAAPDAAATARLGFELGVAADRGRMPSFADRGARAGYALDYFCRVRLLGDVLFGQRMNGWRHEEQTKKHREQSSSSSSSSAAAAAAPSYLGDTIADLLCSPEHREVCRIGSLGGGPGFDHVAATVLATHAALEREVRHCLDANAEASFPDGTDETESDGLPRLDVEDVLSHLSSRTASPMPRIETTVYEYERGWDDIIPFMEQATQSVLNLGPERHSCRFAGCDITVPLTHDSNAECHKQVQSTDLWICSYCVAENAIRLRANGYVFFEELFEAAQEGAVFVFTETTHRLWPELIDVATKANAAAGREAAGGFDVAFPRIQRGRGKAGFQLALRKAAGATLGEEVKATCERFRRDNAMHELKISGGYKRQKRKIRGAK